MTIKSYKETLRGLIDDAILFQGGLTKLRDILQLVSNYHPTSPDEFSTAVSNENVKETAYQRAIFLSQPRSTLDGVGVVSWLDMELPVVFGKKGRRRSLDLLGKTGTKQLVFCELKYDGKLHNPGSKAKPSAGSPLYAFFEILIYYFHIWNNKELLQESNLGHSNKRDGWVWSDSSPEGVKLIVAANERYWSQWKKNKIWPAMKEKIEEIKQALPDISIDFFQSASPEVEFFAQAVGKKTYLPSLGGNCGQVWKNVTL